jgi:DNA-binding transcriptional LysR family regulator
VEEEMAMETGLRRLRYFSTLATELNFRRTAEKLNITQPALSRAIAQLEEEVGVRLLERSNRHVKLTLAGENFANGCNRLLEGLNATIDQTLKVARGFAGTLAVGYTDTAIAGKLPDLIRSLLGDAPELHIQLIQAYSKRQLEMLHDGTIDIGIVTGPVEDNSLRSVDIQTDRFVALVPRGNPLAGNKDVALADLAEYRFVLGDPEAWGIYNALLFEHCERGGIRPQIVQTAPESRAIVGLVACDLGVSIMPESVTHTVDERIVVLPIRDINGQMITQAVWLKDSKKPAVARFVQHQKDLVE